jgi:ZIP family zinc transporter
MIQFNNILFAFLLTIFAGLATGIGSVLAFFTKRTNKKFLSVSLGFSAGVMIYVSFVEILYTAQNILVKTHGIREGSWIVVFSFFIGILIVTLIDRLVPSFENPHEIRQVEDMRNAEKSKKCRALYRLGILTAVAIAVHNFPEGIATFVAAVTNLSIGIPIAIAIAIHNIPEGIAISVPIYYATRSKKKAFFYSFLSGLTEPLGALIGFLLLRHFITDTLMGIIFAGVAGIMVFVALDELLPSAQKYGEHHLSIIGLIFGMGVMAVSLLLFL